MGMGSLRMLGTKRNLLKYNFMKPVKKILLLLLFSLFTVPFLLQPACAAGLCAMVCV